MRAMVRTGLGIVLLFVLVSGTASAGSRGQPEGVDPRGDVADPNTGVPLDLPNADIRAVWFEEDDDDFEVHLRVRDLDPAYRSGTNGQDWYVFWETGGMTWMARLSRSSIGPDFGEIAESPTRGYTNRPSTLNGATIEFDLALDEIVLTLPRTFTVQETTGASVVFDFDDGTVFANVRAMSLDGQGTGDQGCDVCSNTPGLDHTAPGDDFEFGRGSASNPHLVVKPGAAVIPVRRGTTVPVPVSGFTPADLDLGATLTATLSRDDWTLEDATLPMQLGSDAKGAATFLVEVPAFAAPGDTAVLTVTGGAFATSTALVVADSTTDPVAAAAARLFAGVLPPGDGPKTARPLTLYLQGETDGGASRPVLPGRLVASAANGSAPDSITVAGQNMAPVGTWVGDPLVSASNLTGVVRADLYATWSNVNGLKLRALVGPAPLPIDWDGVSTPPGTVALESAVAGTSGTNALLTATGQTGTAIPLQKGDRLAVSLFLARTGGTNAVTASVFSKATPSTVTFNLEEPTLPPLVPGVAPLGKVAGFGAAFAPPTGLATTRALEGTLTGPAGTPVPLPFVATPQDVHLGNKTNAPGTKTLTGTPFAPQFDAGREQTFAFSVGPKAKLVEIVLTAPHGNDRVNDNDLDLVVRKADGTFVRASRSDGPNEAILLGPELLGQYGPGAYQAVVRYDRVGAGQAAVVTPTLTVRQHDAVDVKDAYLSGRFLWSYAGKPLGDYALDVSLADGRGQLKQSAVYRLTNVGPTLAPTADFSYAPVLPVSGQAVNFTDLSVDLDGKLAKWTWRFGDGTTSSLQNPSHAFPRPGAYTVNLTVADDFNATAVSVSRIVDVGNAPPVAAFTVDPVVGTVGQTARFTDRSFDPDGNISAREWTFDDGSGSTEALVEHVFTVAGTYNVSLTVFDEPRSVLSGSRLVRAYVVVDPGAASSGRPTPDFEPPLNPVEGRPARFTDASFWEEGILERRWDFGDGGVSNATDPLHTFAASGEYQVTLTVFPPGRSDLTASVTRTIRVAAASGIAAAFTFDPVDPATSDVVTFTDTTTSLKGDVTRHWDFGDGTTAAGATATHVFPRPGTFLVRLTVSDPDGAQAVGERHVRVERAALVAKPAPDVPRGGSLFHYKADYDKGVEHKEDYAATWRQDELAGLLKANADYLATPGAYVYGTARATPAEVSWQGGAAHVPAPSGAVTKVLGAVVSQDMGAASARALAPATAAIGSRPVDLSALDAPVTDQDDLDDGLFRVETVLEGGGIQVRRATTVLDGALHADVRTVMTGQPDDPMRLVTEVALSAPYGSWIATWDGDAVRVLPVAGADNATYDLGGHANRWFAVYDTATKQVSGVVVSGDVTGITLLVRDSEVVVRADHVGLGEVLAAEYLVAYEVTDADATRYAGVMELARQDDQEIGLAVLGDGRAAALAWTGSRASLGVDATSGLGAFWGRVNGVPGSWTLILDASSDNDGKAMRVVLPGSVVRDGGVRLLLDGTQLSALDFEALADDGTLVLVVPIENFSRHELEIQTVVPGLPKPFLWLGLAFGVVVGGGALFGGQQMRSRAVARALGEAPSAPDVQVVPGVRSAAVQRALGEMDAPAANEVKSALLRKLTEGQGSIDRARYARCTNCQSPIRFGPGETATECTRCGANNTQTPGGDT